MQITYDEAKNAANIAKHGVALADADRFEWDTAIVWADTREDYAEARMVALGYIGLRIHCVVYVDRATVRRIISLRKANKREVQRYAET